MVFQAADASVLTVNTISDNNAADVKLELTLAENKIRLAAGSELYQVIYNATIIGNPSANPQITSNLTENQLSFYNLLINSGYLVTLDVSSGYWKISWAPQGPETLVKVYSFRTTVVPGPVYLDTIAAIEAYFLSLSPTAHSIGVTNSDISETDFGGVSSTFYEYTIVVDQGIDNTDHSTGVKAQSLHKESAITAVTVIAIS
jgi:hypothetical protein